MAEGTAYHRPIPRRVVGFTESAYSRTRRADGGRLPWHGRFVLVWYAVIAMYVTMTGALTRVVERSIQRLVTDSHVLAFHTA